MDRAETLKIFSVIKAEYRNHFKDISAVDANAMVDLWTEMFADVDYSIVGAAVKSYILTNTSGHPPKVGQINELIRKLTQPEAMTEQEASNLIFKALSNSIYNAEAEYNKLPPILQTLVGSPNMLREWAMMDSDTVKSVISSNLMRSYRVAEERQRIKEALPSNIRAMLEEVSNRMSIDGNVALITE